MRRFLNSNGLVAGLALAIGLNAAPATAATFNGQFWDAPGGSIANITQAINYATTNTPDATFLSTSIAYGNPATNFAISDLADFLGADAGSIVGSNPDFQESVILLTGSSFLSNGDTISVTSDDGFRLTIGGMPFSQFAGTRGPGGTTSGTFNGVDGVYAVSLWYFEGQPTQAQLQSNLTPVPLPAAGFLLLGGLGGMVALRRRRKPA